MEESAKQQEPGERILLLVDNNPIDLLITQRMLYKAGFTGKIVSVDSAQAALHYLQSCAQTDQYPFLILLDLSMPLLSGLDFLERCQQGDYLKEQSVKIILLTSSVRPADYQQAQQYGVGWLAKPLAVEKLQLLL